MIKTIEERVAEVLNCTMPEACNDPRYIKRGRHAPGCGADSREEVVALLREERAEAVREEQNRWRGVIESEIEPEPGLGTTWSDPLDMVMEWIEWRVSKMMDAQDAAVKRGRAEAIESAADSLAEHLRSLSTSDFDVVAWLKARAEAER